MEIVLVRNWLKMESGEVEIICHGNLLREPESDISVADYILANEYVGCEVSAEYMASYRDLDDEKHQYLINISDISGSIKIVFNGGYTDHTGNNDSEFKISDITLY